MSTEFSKRLRQWLDEKNVKGGQTRLAEHVGVTHQTVQQWASGKTEPKNDMYPLIADYFGKTEIELRYGKAIISEGSAAKYAVEKIESIHNIDESEINAEELTKIIGSNIASASLDKLLAIKKILEMKDEHVTGAHELIELVEQLLAKKRSNGE